MAAEVFARVSWGSQLKLNVIGSLASLDESPNQAQLCVKSTQNLFGVGIVVLIVRPIEEVPDESDFSNRAYDPFLCQPAETLAPGGRAICHILHI
jgi:hypothetical protein